MSRPTVPELDEVIGVARWERFATHLPGLQAEDIEKMKTDNPNDVTSQKLALYRKWLSCNPDAKWSDVAKALDTSGEKSLAEKVRTEKCSLANNFHKGDRVPKEINFPADDEKQIMDELKSLHQSYTKLFSNVRQHIEELVNSEKRTLYSVVAAIEDQQIDSLKGLNKCGSIEEVFSIIREHSMFLDGSILEVVVQSVLGSQSEFLKRAATHCEKAMKFKMEKPIRCLKDKLVECDVGRNHTFVTIKMNNPWGRVGIGLVEKLVRELLQYKGEMHWLSVVHGCVCLTVLVPLKEKEGELIILCSSKSQFMHLVGVFSLVIDTSSVFHEEENVSYTFESSLLEACKLQNTAAVQFLLYLGTNVNHTDKDGKTALMLSSLHGNFYVSKLLLTAGGNPNIQDTFGNHSAGFSCFHGHYLVTELLLNNLANPNLPTNDGWTPLMMASQEGHHKIVELLLENGVDPDVRNSENGRTALIQASQNGHDQVIKVLLAAGANPNVQGIDGSTAVLLASLGGCYTAAEFLLKSNANPNLPDSDGWTPLTVACQEGHHRLVSLLVHNEVDPNIVNKKNGTSALMQASENGHYKIVEFLLSIGCNPDLQNIDGDTPMHLATVNGHYTIAELLLENGGNPNIPDNDGWTPLMVASLEGQSKIVELLLQKGIDPNGLNTKNGRTALSQASQCSHYDTVELLLKAKANPNIKDSDGFTAIEIAHANGHSRIVQLLDGKGINSNQPENIGRTLPTTANMHRQNKEASSMSSTFKKMISPLKRII